MASIIVLLLLAAAAVVIIAFTAGDEAGGNGGTGTGRPAAEGNGAGPPGSQQPGAGNAGSAQGGNPLSNTAPPPLPSGEPATHYGEARLTTVVSGQTFTVDVGITVRLDGAGGFLFAYAGTGTVPVYMAPGVAATADYGISGSFDGTIEGEAFSGSGPAAIQATVAIPGMSPQGGGSTEQLTIRGTMRETEEGRLEGEFTGGSYSGTFRAEAV